MLQLPLTPFEGYLLSLTISSFILLILWILIVRQLCVTVIGIGNRRLRQVTLLTIFSSLSLVHNALIYLTNMYSEYWILHIIPLWRMTYVVEALSFMLGFHLYGLCELSIINGIYFPIDMDPPKWFQITLCIIRNKKLFYIAAVAVIYGFVLSDRHNITLWSQRFYAFLTLVVGIESLAITFVLKRVLRILNTMRCAERINERKLLKAKRGIRASMTVFILLCVVSILSFGIAVQLLCHYLPIDLSAYVVALQMCIMHSIFLILINTSLFFWIYKRRRCCTLRRGTVCDFFGFVDIMEWIVKVLCCRKRKESKRFSLLFEHSVQSRDTDQGTTTDDKITTLNSNIAVLSSTRTT